MISYRGHLRLLAVTLGPFVPFGLCYGFYRLGSWVPHDPCKTWFCQYVGATVVGLFLTLVCGLFLWAFVWVARRILSLVWFLLCCAGGTCGSLWTWVAKGYALDREAALHAKEVERVRGAVSVAQRSGGEVSLAAKPRMRVE